MVFYGLVNFKYYFGVLEFPDIFGGERYMLGPSLEKLRVPPLSETIRPVRIQFVCVYTNGLLFPYILNQNNIIDMSQTREHSTRTAQSSTVG